LTLIGYTVNIIFDLWYIYLEDILPIMMIFLQRFGGRE